MYCDNNIDKIRTSSRARLLFQARTSINEQVIFWGIVDLQMFYPYIFCVTLMTRLVHKIQIAAI